MKKIAISISILLIIFSTYITYDYFSGYEVLKIVDADTIYVDLNRNGEIDKDENIRLKSIDAFEIKYSYYLTKQALRYNISKKQALGLGYLGKEFAKKKLLGKRVKLHIDGKGDFNRKLAHINILFWDYEKEILKAGLADVFDCSDDAKEYKKYENLKKIKANVTKAKSLDLVLINLKNNKVHKPYCKYAKNMSRYDLLQVKDLPEEAKQAGCCKDLKEAEEKLAYEKPIPDVNTNFIDLYFIDPTKYKKPAKYCRTSASQALLKEIQNAKKSIHFAIYGISNQPEIFHALIDAKNRGVDVKWVTDMTEKNYNIYHDTKFLIQELGNVKTDYIPNEKIPEYKHKLEYQGGLMHNKFFIFDTQKVWSGSTNISSTGLGGYNSNIGILIKDKQVAEIYKKEFDQMYFSNKFHLSKDKIMGNKQIKLKDGSAISIYFSPKDSEITEVINNKIRTASKYVYIPMFFLTRSDIIKSIIFANNKGIDVKLIVDATSATAYYSRVDYLRSKGVNVKVENFGGKMHMKSAIIDDKTIVVGSMNWTKHGTNLNDENSMIIDNSKLAKFYKIHFLTLWNVIPEKWTNKTPSPESIDSINSCNDGVDNDHNRKIDKYDKKCSFLLDSIQ